MQQQLISLLPRAIACPAGSGHRVVPLGAGGRRPASLGRVRAYAYPTTRRAIKVSPAVVDAPKSCLLQDASVAAPNPCLQLLQDAPHKKAANQQHTNDSSSEGKFFEVEMSVDDNELDEYGVVNNAIYASYIHSGRDVFLENVGIGVEYWTSTGNALALSELNLKFFTPLRKGDRFVVKLRVVQIKGVRIIVDHLIETLPDRKLVLDARATAVCLDKNYRPTRVFPELSAKLHQFFLS